MLTYEGRTLSKWRGAPLGVTVSQRDWELAQLIEVFKAQQPKYIVEIGSQDGGTLYQWITHAPPGAVIVNIDILENQTDPDAVLKRWQDWAHKRNDIRLYTFIGRSQSDEAIAFVKERMPEINFLFIDGDHRYRGVKQDWINYGSMTNGVVAFHDLMTPKNGVQDHITVGKLWNEIQHVGYPTREIWAGADPDWGGIGLVYHVKPEGTTDK